MGARRVAVAVCAALAAWLVSGAFVVESGERGVVRSLGHVRGPLRPGAHWTWPWPFARVDRPATTEVRRVDADFTHDATSDAVDGVLTADTHLLDVRAGLHYQVVDPVAFVVVADDSDALVARALRSALVEAVGAVDVDTALSSGRAAIGRDVHARAQARLDAVGAGVLVTAVTLETLEAPSPVRPSFRDVVGARKDAERAVERARSEAVAIISAAEGDAARLVEEAHGRAARARAEARGAAARFTSLLAEHRRAPEAFERRAVLETLETVLPRLRTFVVDPGRPPLRLVEPRDG